MAKKRKKTNEAPQKEATEESKETSEEELSFSISFKINDIWKISTIILAIVLACVLAFKWGCPVTGSAVSNEVTSTDAKVSLTILTDSKCSICNSYSQLQQAFGVIFSNLEVNTVDISSTQGQSLLNSLNISIIPAFIFDSSVTQASNYTAMSPYLTYQNGYYIFNQSIASRNLGGFKYIKRETPSKPSVDLFIMSMCPYGNLAVKNVKEFINAFGDDVNFNIHYIVDIMDSSAYQEKINSGYGSYYQSSCTKKDDGYYYCSLHGPTELNEDIRQVCVIHYYPNVSYQYILSRAEDYDNYSKCFSTCYSEYYKDGNSTKLNECNEECKTNFTNSWIARASSLNIDTQLITSCSEGLEGLQLLRENINLTQELGIGASPTFLINNQLQFGGAKSSEYIKNTLCGEIDNSLSACSITLNDTTESASGMC